MADTNLEFIVDFRTSDAGIFINGEFLPSNAEPEDTDFPSELLMSKFDPAYRDILSPRVGNREICVVDWVHEKIEESDEGTEGAAFVSLNSSGSTLTFFPLKVVLREGTAKYRQVFGTLPLSAAGEIADNNFLNIFQALTDCDLVDVVNDWGMEECLMVDEYNHEITLSIKYPPIPYDSWESIETVARMTDRSDAIDELRECLGGIL